MANYSTMTNEEFDTILESLVSQMSAGEILGYGDVYATLSEELNNAVLQKWEDDNPERAFPEDQDHA